MSQVIWNTIVPSVTSGNQLAALLNSFKDAVVSGFCGTSRPSQLQAGGYWIDQTNDSSGTWDMKLYDGSQDIVLLTINKTTGTVSVPGSASTFTITRTSDDTIGATLNMVKKRSSGIGQTLIGDELGVVNMRGTRDDGATVTTARMKAVARNDYTSSQQGVAFIWEAIDFNSSSLVEKMRLQDGRLGINSSDPVETVHAVGSGILSEKASDDAVGAMLATRKRRIAGTGAVQNNDTVATWTMRSTDETNSAFTAAEIYATATENHSTTAQGTKLRIRTRTTGGTTLSDKLEIGDQITSYVQFNATTAVITNLSVTNLTAMNAEIVTKVETDDANIELNKGGTQAAANLAVAGFTVLMTDSTKALLGYDSSLASKFKCGVDGSLKEIVDVSSTQQLANKSVETPSRLDVKQGTESALTTYAASATNGQWCFATDTKTMYQVIDGALVPAGSGGGGSSLTWTKSGTISPNQTTEDGFVLEDFSYEEGQEVYATFVVPTSYRAGKQITLVGAAFFCAVNSGNVLFRADCALLKPGTTVLGTYPNSRTTTNTQLTLSGTANTLTNVGTLDITSSTGQINGVAVAPGDKLRIRLYRLVSSETSPAAANARMLLNAIEVKLS